MKWIDIDKTAPPDKYRILLCDVYGRTVIGAKDIFGYWDDSSHELEDIIAWAYLPRPPWGKGKITNEKWLKMLKDKGHSK